MVPSQSASAQKRSQMSGEVCNVVFLNNRSHTDLQRVYFDHGAIFPSPVEATFIVLPALSLYDLPNFGQRHRPVGITYVVWVIVFHSEQI